MSGFKFCRISALFLFQFLVSPALAQDPPSDHRPVISPDGQTIVFMSTREEGDWELYRISRDGTNLERLTRHEGWDGYAAFSPNGKTFTYDREEGEQKTPYIYNFETGEIRPFLEMEGAWATVNGWHPDGNRVVLFIERNKSRDLYFADENGQNLEQVTDTPQKNEHEGAFSPDGSKLAYATQNDAGSGLEVMDLENGGTALLVTSSQYLYGLSWSPDGTKIAYTDTPNDNPDGNAELYVLDLASETVERLTHDDHYDHMPVWLPDGKRIMFTSYRSGREEIYLLNLASDEVEVFDTGLE